MEPFVLLATALGLFIVERATGGIIGEYAKRFWFARVHRQSAERRQREAELDGMRRQIETQARLLERVIEENEALRARLGQTSAETLTPPTPSKTEETP